jgi:transcriptional regulator with XRE-family HTH domain
MPLINVETFERRRQKLRLTAKEIAHQARVTETTVGKVKKGSKLNTRTVEQIAKALSLTFEEITSPPAATSTAQNGMDDLDKEYLAAASILYGVPQSWILKHSVLFFTILAEQFLSQRKEKAEKWLNDFSLLDGLYPSKDEWTDSRKEEYIEAAQDELNAISNYDLSGPRDTSKNQNARFINFLDENFNVEGEMLDTHYKDGSERKCELLDLCYYLLIQNQAVDKLLPFIGPDQDPDGWIHRENARDYFDGYLHNGSLNDIPAKLLDPHRRDDLEQWVLARLEALKNDKTSQNPATSLAGHEDSELANLASEVPNA